MTGAELWKRYQKYLFTDADLGFALDISRIRFADDFLAKLQPAMEQAFTAMDKLEAGAIANADENRMVGHYWLRDPALAPNDDLRKEVTESYDAVKQFAAKVLADKKFKQIIHIGIGGSALGPQFIAQALAPHPPLAIHFIDNTDPEGIDLLMQTLRPKLGESLVIVVSKSGSTPEPRNGMLEVKAAFEAAGVPFAPHAVAVTMPGSHLDKTAKSEGWLAMIPMQDWVGGRTSVMSAVGLLPAALLGIDCDAFLAGAAAMDVITRRHEVMQNPAALLALAWYHVGNGKGEKDMVILPYKDRLVLFSKYLQQLVMESLGKEQDRQGKTVHQGIAVYGNKGSTDQHAYIQQLRDGVANFFATFIEVRKDRPGMPMEVEPGVTAGDYLFGFLLGTRRALYENQRDSITITIDTVTARSVGSLIALYERAVGLYAELVNINAYHQPGVEAGKKAAAAVLKLQSDVIAAVRQSTQPHTADEIATKIGQPDEVESVYLLLDHLSSNDRLMRVSGVGPTSTFRA